jgi:ribosomal RNA-processing protein 36
MEKKSKSEKSKPLEFSCRKPVAVPKPQRQGLVKRQEEFEDPRFNRKVSGELSSDMFAKAFSFLDDYRDAEKKEVAARLTFKQVGADEKARLEKALARMQSQDVARKKLTMESEIRKELKQKELEAVAKSGKRAYFHPRSVVKQIMKDRKEEELRSKGQLDRFKAKQEKRKTSEDRKNIPRTRRIVEFH